MKIYNKTQNREIGPVHLASSFTKRLKGLWGTDPTKEEGALWLIPCCGIHTIGMLCSLDVVFLDRNQRVMRVEENVRPFRLGPVCRGAHSVLENFHGRWDLSAFEAGDELELVGGT